MIGFQTTHPYIMRVFPRDIWNIHKESFGINYILSYTIIKDWSTLFSFALGNERILVACKSLRSASVLSIPNANVKQCTSIPIFMLERWKTLKSRKKKSMLIFPSRDQCLSLENIWHSFPTLHCRRSVNITKWPHQRSLKIFSCFSTINFLE